MQREGKHKNKRKASKAKNKSNDPGSGNLELNAACLMRRTDKLKVQHDRPHDVEVGLPPLDHASYGTMPAKFPVMPVTISRKLELAVVKGRGERDERGNVLAVSFLSFIAFFQQHTATFT